MRVLLFIALVAALVALLLFEHAGAQGPAVDRTAPYIASVGDGSFAALAGYGHAIVTRTSNQIAPAAADPGKR